MEGGNCYMGSLFHRDQTNKIGGLQDLTPSPLKIRHGDKLPVIGGINLNNKMPAFKEMVVQG